MKYKFLQKVKIPSNNYFGEAEIVLRSNIRLTSARVTTLENEIYKVPIKVRRRKNNLNIKLNS